MRPPFALTATLAVLLALAPAARGDERPATPTSAQTPAQTPAQRQADLGTRAEKSGDTDEARARYAAALALDAKNVAARAALRRLAGIESTPVPDALARLRSNDRRVRLLAARELGRTRLGVSAPALVRAAVRDSDAAVRHAAVDALAELPDDAQALPSLMKQADGATAKIRENAVRAIARLGDPRAIEYLVYRVDARGGGAPRTYSAFTSQVAFVQDFDVEVS